MWQQLLNNHALQAGLLAWLLAQVAKPFFEFPETRRWNWGLMLTAGGMPSSHSALMCAMMLGIGLFNGFDTPAFAIAVAITMVVVYDAAGVRRQAGIHAQRINQLIQEIFSGRPITEERLLEVLGHTPREVIAGVTLGLVTAAVMYLLLKP